MRLTSPTQSRPAFSCALAGFKASGYGAFYYPTLIDPTVAATRPNFDEVGATATLFLVGEQCVNAAGSSALSCSPFNPDGLLVRDILKVPITFTAGEGGGVGSPVPVVTG
jgi:hypothetical protein